jgi:hypothetical protein
LISEHLHHVVEDIWIVTIGIAKMVKHHLMIGTWTPPGVIITVAFDDETLKLELVKKTEIPEDEPISWMAFDVCAIQTARCDGSSLITRNTASKEEHIWRVHEEMEFPRSQKSERDCTHRKLPNRRTS